MEVDDGADVLLCQLWQRRQVIRTDDAVLGQRFEDAAGRRRHRTGEVGRDRARLGEKHPHGRGVDQADHRGQDAELGQHLDDVPDDLEAMH